MKQEEEQEEVQEKVQDEKQEKQEIQENYEEEEWEEEKRISSSTTITRRKWGRIFPEAHWCHQLWSSYVVR